MTDKHSNKATHFTSYSNCLFFDHKKRLGKDNEMMIFQNNERNSSISIIREEDILSNTNKLADLKPSNWERSLNKISLFESDKWCQAHDEKSEHFFGRGARHKIMNMESSPVTAFKNIPLKSPVESNKLDDFLLESTTAHGLYNPTKLINLKTSNWEENLRVAPMPMQNQSCQKLHSYNVERETQIATQSTKRNMKSENAATVENIKLKRQFDPDEWDVIDEDSEPCSRSIFKNSQGDHLSNQTTPFSFKSFNLENKLCRASGCDQLCKSPPRKREKLIQKRVNRKKSSMNPEKDDIQLGKDFQPGTWDVICGRGRHSLKHIGNRRFRILLTIHLPRYIEASCRNEKTKIIDIITNQIIDASPSGGFVMQNAQGYWYRCGQSLARKKVSHALRDWTREHRHKDQYNSNERSTSIIEIQDSIFKSLYLI